MSNYDFNINNENNFNNNSKIIDFSAYSVAAMLLFNVLESYAKENNPVVSVSTKTIIVKSVMMQMKCLSSKDVDNAVNHAKALYETLRKSLVSYHIEYEKSDLVEMFIDHKELLIEQMKRQLSVVNYKSDFINSENLKEKVVEILESNEDNSNKKSEPVEIKVDFNNLQTLSIAELKELEKSCVEKEQYENTRKIFDVIQQKETDH